MKPEVIVERMWDHSRSPATPYWTAMFHIKPPSNVVGCPMGRAIRPSAAVTNLLCRTNNESKLNMKRSDIKITKVRINRVNRH